MDHGDELRELQIEVVPTGLDRVDLLLLDVQGQAEGKYLQALSTLDAAAVSAVDLFVADLQSVHPQRDHFPGAASAVQHDGLAGHERAVKHHVVVRIAADPHAVARYI